MKRILSCTLIMTLAVSLALCLTVMAGSKAEAASDAQKAQEFRAKEAGLVAISDSKMALADAKVFCRMKGGKFQNPPRGQAIGYA